MSKLIELLIWVFGWGVMFWFFWVLLSVEL
jgi:hypothetical protein